MPYLVCIKVSKWPELLSCPTFRAAHKIYDWHDLTQLAGRTGTFHEQDKMTGEDDDDEDPVSDSNNRPLPETTHGFESVCLLSDAHISLWSSWFRNNMHNEPVAMCVMLILRSWIAVKGQSWLGVLGCFGFKVYWMPALASQRMWCTRWFVA